VSVGSVGVATLSPAAGVAAPLEISLAFGIPGSAQILSLVRSRRCACTPHHLGLSRVLLAMGRRRRYAGMKR